MNPPCSSFDSLAAYLKVRTADGKGRSSIVGFSLRGRRRESGPVTINCEFPDPKRDLDDVSNESREKKAKNALSISAGFEGVNAAILFKKCEEVPLPF
jgi:hypothetical protein